MTTLRGGSGAEDLQLEQLEDRRLLNGAYGPQLLSRPFFQADPPPATSLEAPVVIAAPRASLLAGTAAVVTATPSGQAATLVYRPEASAAAITAYRVNTSSLIAEPFGPATMAAEGALRISAATSAQGMTAQGITAVVGTPFVNPLVGGTQLDAALTPDPLLAPDSGVQIIAPPVGGSQASASDANGGISSDMAARLGLTLPSAGATDQTFSTTSSRVETASGDNAVVATNVVQVGWLDPVQKVLASTPIPSPDPGNADASPASDPGTVSSLSAADAPSPV